MSRWFRMGLSGTLLRNSRLPKKKPPLKPASTQKSSLTPRPAQKKQERIAEQLLPTSPVPDLPQEVTAPLARPAINAFPTHNSTDTATPNYVPAKSLRIDNPASGRAIHRGWQLMRQRALWLRASSTTAWHATISEYKRLRENWPSASYSINFRDEVTRGKQCASTVIRSGIVHTQRYSHTIQSSVIVPLRARVAKIPQAAASLRNVVAPRVKDISGYFAKTNQAIVARVRALLASLLLGSGVLLARKISQWEKRRGTAIDERLWTSMTLAAISAVLALVIVSIVPHYASKSLPSRLFQNPVTVSANTTAPDKTTVRVESEKNPSSIATASSVSSDTNGVSPSSTPAKLVNTADHPRNHRSNDDEDYVAPNTYKYYGNDPGTPKR
jgi:hypothetical protein